MIKNAADDRQNLTINVKLKNGQLFLDKDITSNPLNDNTVSFWYDDKIIRTYPMNEIEYFDFNVETD